MGDGPALMWQNSRDQSEGVGVSGDRCVGSSPDQRTLQGRTSKVSGGPAAAPPAGREYTV